MSLEELGETFLISRQNMKHGSAFLSLRFYLNKIEIRRVLGLENILQRL